MNCPITNDIRYIGRTKNKLSYRLSNHINTSKSNHNTYKINWIKSLLKQGLKPTINLIKEIDCTWEESHIIETYIIKEYFEKGYKLVNLVDRGSGNYGIKYKQKRSTKPILQYSLDGDFIKEYSSISEAAKELNTSLKLISKGLRGNKTAQGYMWKYKISNNYLLKIIAFEDIPNIHRRKSVFQLDLNDNIIKEWVSIAKITKELGINQSDISVCCKYNHKTSYGSKWKWKENKE